jgi:pseudouridylate synthase
MTGLHPMLRPSEEVREALGCGGPVVALESTIISHGMPYPDNIAMAREVEQIVRDGGATPATVAVLGGVPRVGLDDDELEVLGSDPDVTKVSVRDLPYVVARGRHGATTVAATMRVAALAGIPVFVTGGLGGVHHGAESSMDVSADLTELGRTDVAVVCAGVKSILDIGRTLEVLETLGVPVIGVGSREFPGFYSRRSGFEAPMAVAALEDGGADELAATLRAKWSMHLHGGVVIANPVPERDEIPAEEMQGVIEEALGDSLRRGVAGKDVTPYLLGRIVEITGGRSLATNIALVRHNARLGAALARAYAVGG